MILSGRDGEQYSGLRRAWERIIKRTVFKRPGEPADISHAIAFLCSDEAGYITGHALEVSGGISLFTF